jgi:type IV pilus assembly protein PilX
MTRTFVTPSAERGASLIIGLVLLLVLSVLAISTMSSATFGLAMTGNAQYSENAFQMAETGVDLSLAGGGYRNGGNSAIPATVVNDANGDQIGTFNAATSFQETTPPPKGGFSIGSGSATFDACHFQTVATGASARNATSQHTQEFYVICPGGS